MMLVSVTIFIPEFVLAISSLEMGEQAILLYPRQ